MIGSSKHRMIVIDFSLPKSISSILGKLGIEE